VPSVWLGFEPGMTKPDFLRIACHDIAGCGLGDPITEPEDRLAPAAFSLAGESRTRTILEEAGYEEIDIGPFDTMIGGLSVEQCFWNSLQGAIGTVLEQYPTPSTP
jgi:hypothetical protein